MKPLRIETFLLASGDMACAECMAAISVYNQYKGGEPIYENTICHTGTPTEVMAYILKKYIINKNLKWNKVEYDKNNSLMILYGEDKRP